MDDLIAFLGARIDEDEVAARQAIPGPWLIRHDSVGDTHVYSDTPERAYTFPNAHEGSATHAVRHDPAHVLREVAAKRRILADWVEASHDPFEDMSDDERHQFDVHPAYEYETTQGPRKAWDDADVPPEGEGWERNTTSADPDGWERFEYHEESYWRRLRPGGPQAREMPMWRHIQLIASVYADHPDYREEWRP